MSPNSPFHNIPASSKPQKNPKTSSKPTSKPKKSKYSKPSQNVNQMPTVPMSVYRELAGELETTKSQLESLKQTNKKLNQQNQSLRLEISNLVHSVQRLEYTLQYWDQSSEMDSELSHWKQPKGHSRSDQWHDDDAMDGVPTEMEFPYNKKQLSGSQGINGWLLLVVVMLIIISFAGLGFAVARPLLKGNLDTNE